MITYLLEVLTCSNFTCSSGPSWFDIVENWAAHLGLGALIGVLLPKRWTMAAFAALLFKEGAGDFAHDPSAIVVVDSVLDLAATALGAWIGCTKRKTEAHKHG